MSNNVISFYIPTTVDVHRIASQSDPVLRNLQITQCYHELSLVLEARARGVANWCTFATWASKQAGQTIRKEDLIRSLDAALGSEATAIQMIEDIKAAVQSLGIPIETEKILDLLWKAYDPPTAFERSSLAVAQGNLKVFAEIAYQFARFYVECLPDQVHTPENIARFLEPLRPGDPPDGQQYLSLAFQHYYQALFEEDLKMRIELVLLANLEIGYHEQTRLQPEINEALEAPVLSPQDFTRNLIKVLQPEAGWIAIVGLFLMRCLGRLDKFDAAIDTFTAWVRCRVEYIVTETLMTIELPPSLRLRLGDDLTAGFPPELQCISNPDLLTLLLQIDPTPDSTRQSGAANWGDLSDRIHFIADMFRCYQICADLQQAPFTQEQTQAIKENCLPSGRL